MRFSDKRIKDLKLLLKQRGLDYSDEQAREAGAAIIRFVIAKTQRKNNLMKGDKLNGKQNSSI